MEAECIINNIVTEVLEDFKWKERMKNNEVVI